MKMKKSINDLIDRFDIVLEYQIGFCVGWEAFRYEHDISIRVPFMTIIIGFGKSL